jgi:Arc/MetJ-type ribon-helix-helix transcriptional regulator
MDHFTNKDAHWRGHTVVLSTRVPEPFVEVIDKAIVAGEFESRTAVTQHAIAKWAIEYEEQHEDG